MKNLWEAVLQQYGYEVESWERLLHFLKQENAYLKSRLGALVSSAGDHALVSWAENFQEETLSQDRTIAFLEEELKLQKARLQKDLYADTGILLKEIAEKQKKLQGDIKRAEAFFSGERCSFEQYLEEHLATDLTAADGSRQLM
jgi:hypothetical protein